MNRTGLYHKMDMKYKCCKKELNSYCCITCSNIFHKSCSSRKSDLIVIEGHKIYCSKLCAEKNNDEINLTKELHLEISKLSKEIEEKDTYINTIRRKTKDFENDVFDSEQNYITEINDQKIVINRLTKKLEQLTQNNKNIEENIIKDKTKFETCKKEMKELHKVIKTMHDEIEKLNIDNRRLSEELNKCKEVINTSESRDVRGESSTKQEKINDFRSNVGSKQLMEAHKIMIIGDEYGHNLNVTLKQLLDKDMFKIETIIKPGASFSGVIENIASLAKTYTLTDYIIIVAGANDFENNKYPSFKNINNKLKSCTHTNIIITTVPFIINRKINKYINKFNNKLNDYLFRLNKYTQGNVNLLDINNNSGTISNKRVIAKQLAYLIKNSKNMNKVLIFVKVHEKIENVVFEKPNVVEVLEEDEVEEVELLISEEQEKSIAEEILENGTNEENFLEVMTIHNTIVA